MCDRPDSPGVGGQPAPQLTGAGNSGSRRAPGNEGCPRGARPQALSGSGRALLPQSVENCMCILHNLSYRLDAEVPTRYRQLEHYARNAHTEKSSTSCFSNKSGKMTVSGPPVLPGPAASPGDKPQHRRPTPRHRHVPRDREGAPPRPSLARLPLPPEPPSFPEAEGAGLRGVRAPPTARRCGPGPGPPLDPGWVKHGLWEDIRV